MIFQRVKYMQKHPLNCTVINCIGPKTKISKISHIFRPFKSPPNTFTTILTVKGGRPYSRIQKFVTNLNKSRWLVHFKLQKLLL